MTNQPKGSAIDLAGPFDLAGGRTVAPHIFETRTRYLHFSPAGLRTTSEEYALRLSCDSTIGSPVTCLRLTVEVDDRPVITIPELRNWSYTFDPSLSGADERGPLWGIPHDRFVRLTDPDGGRLPFTMRYAAYTSFIDFHSVNDAFARPSPVGEGIQDLRFIGQRVSHPASSVQADVHFGTEVQPGSTFTNGMVSLALIGLSFIEGAACGVVEYNAGESRLKMMLAPANRPPSTVEGGSHYRGLMYVDLESRWVKLATLDEYMIAQVTEGIGLSPSMEYTVRHVEIRLVD